jgi:hypothetical protein
MDLIHLAPLTLRFLARVRPLRESTQLFRCAPQLPHDTSYFLRFGQYRCERGLADLQRVTPNVVPVQFDESKAYNQRGLVIAQRRLGVFEKSGLRL